MRSRSERAAFARKVRRARATVRKYGAVPRLRDEQGNREAVGLTAKEKLIHTRYVRAMAVLMEAALKWGSHYPPESGKGLPLPNVLT